MTTIHNDERPLAPHQWRATDDSIMETADGSAWLMDPFEGHLLTYNKARDLAQNIKNEHNIKLSAAYEILGKMMGYRGWHDLCAILEKQTKPDHDIRQKKANLKVRRQVRAAVDFEDQRRAGHELHDAVHGVNQQQPRGDQVTRTGYIVDHGAKPVDQRSVQVVYHAGPETRNRNRKKS